MEEVIRNLGLGFLQMLDFSVFLSLFLGAVAGIITAAIPGLTTDMAMVLCLPITYGLTSMQGLAAMAGIWIGGMSGGLISASLLGIPGTSASIPTTFDGYPMTKKGFPGLAIGLGTWSSFFGGIVGVLSLMIFSPLLAKFATMFGPWEIFALIVFGLTIITGFSEGSRLKTAIAGPIGMIFAMIGADPLYGANRLTFGISELRGGLGFIPMLLGLYAFSQVLIDLEDLESIMTVARRALRVPHWECVKTIVRERKSFFIGSIVGVIVGVVPGVGSTIAALWAYDQAKKFSNHPEKFGTGIPEGIICCEAADSSCVGGDLVPMVSLGIPGNALSAIMMGAVIVHGIAPGPLFISSHPDLAYGLFAALLVSTVVVMLFQLSFVRVIARIVIVPKYLLCPVIMVFCLVGSYIYNNSLFDVWVMFVFGIIGYVFRKIDMPLPPIVIGIVLSDLAELNFRTAYMTSSNLMLFFTRPLSLIFFILAGLSLYYSYRQSSRKGLKITE